MFVGLRIFVLGLFFLSYTQSYSQIGGNVKVSSLDTLVNLGVLTSARAGKETVSKTDSITSITIFRRLKDSINVDQWSTTLRSKIESSFGQINLDKKLDSLRSVGLPEAKLKNISDSLISRRLTLLSEVQEKQLALHNKLKSRYSDRMNLIRQRFNIDSAGLKIKDQSWPRMDLPAENKIGLNSPDLKLGDSGIPPISQLDLEDFSSLGLSKELTEVAGSVAIPNKEVLRDWETNLPAGLGSISDFTDKTAEIKTVAKDPSKLAETSIQKVGEVSAAGKTLSEAEKLKTNNEALKVADQMKDMEGLKASANKEVTNHLKGKDAAVQSAMDRIAEYKRKYSSLGSIADFKKRDWLPRNGLKGIPFRERIRFGMHFGPKLTGDTILLDFYPNVSYRITGRLEAGLGAIYRVRVNTTNSTFDQRDPVWGISTFAVVRTFKSIFLRFEMDGNSFPKSSLPDQSAYRDWRWSFHSGIQSNFKLSKRLIGNVQMLYNFDSSLKDGFPEKLTARAGVQYRWPRK